MKIVYLIFNEDNEPIYAMSSTYEPRDCIDPVWERAEEIAGSIGGYVEEVEMDSPDIGPRPEDAWPFQVYFPNGQEPAEVQDMPIEYGIYPEDHNVEQYGHDFRVMAPDAKIALTKARVKLYAWQKESET